MNKGLKILYNEILEISTINQKNTFDGQFFVKLNKFIVFYNGPDTTWDKKLMKLSDSYEMQTQEPKLELLVTMLNINPGKNAEIFEKCSTLWDYSQYVAKVRLYAQTMEINLAVERAVAECIKEGILSGFLQKYKSEALQMSIFEYDEEEFDRIGIYLRQKWFYEWS